jgi:hypothetical protein
MYIIILSFIDLFQFLGFAYALSIFPILQCIALLRLRHLPGHYILQLIRNVAAQCAADLMSSSLIGSWVPSQ